jgi:hypothetical protein
VDIERACSQARFSLRRVHRDAVTKIENPRLDRKPSDSVPKDRSRRRYTVKTLRIALTTAGALAALVGGAETATWSLRPLSAPIDVSAPRIVASASPDDPAQSATSSNIDPAPLEATAAAYTAPSPSATRAESTLASSPEADDASGASSPPVFEDESGASPDSPTAAPGSAPRDQAESRADARDAGPS